MNECSGQEDEKMRNCLAPHLRMNECQSGYSVTQRDSDTRGKQENFWLIYVELE